MIAYSIPIRSRSEAAYGAKHKEGSRGRINDGGIDFASISFLAGVGFGLYKGIGDNAGNYIQIGSGDPKIINAYIRFLRLVYGVERKSLRFGLRVNGDMDAERALVFWIDALSVSRAQFRKPIVTALRRKKGNSDKRKRGFVTLYCYDSKLKQAILDSMQTHVR